MSLLWDHPRYASDPDLCHKNVGQQHPLLVELLMFKVLQISAFYEKASLKGLHLPMLHHTASQNPTSCKILPKAFSLMIRLKSL